MKLQGRVSESKAKWRSSCGTKITLRADVPELDERGEHALDRADVVSQRDVRGNSLRARVAGADGAKNGFVVFGFAEPAFLVDQRFDLHPDLPAW